MVGAFWPCKCCGDTCCNDRYREGSCRQCLEFLSWPQTLTASLWEPAQESIGRCGLCIPAEGLDIILEEQDHEAGEPYTFESSVTGGAEIVVENVEKVYMSDMVALGDCYSWLEAFFRSGDCTGQIPPETESEYTHIKLWLMCHGCRPERNDSQCINMWYQVDPPCMGGAAAKPPWSGEPGYCETAQAIWEATKSGFAQADNANDPFGCTEGPNCPSCCPLILHYGLVFSACCTEQHGVGQSEQLAVTITEESDSCKKLAELDDCSDNCDVQVFECEQCPDGMARCFQVTWEDVQNGECGSCTPEINRLHVMRWELGCTFLGHGSCCQSELLEAEIGAGESPIMYYDEGDEEWVVEYKMQEGGILNRGAKYTKPTLNANGTNVFHLQIALGACTNWPDTITVSPID